ncbi:MAG TPA: NUDIX hydrolase [Streptosporangiaceae bacterium]|nr:NUDIX hydrolase [Streptosporangiaceae bacterium]
MTERRRIEGRVAVQVRGLVGTHGRAVLDGARPPVAARDAATVMLLRPNDADNSKITGVALAAPAGLRVFMLRRPRTMAFAPGAYVFPGGSVDRSDSDEDTPWAGPGPQAWGQALGVSAAAARAVVGAAVRETFEECGVLLAAPDAQTPPVSTAGGSWAADREAMLAGTLTLARLLQDRRLVLRSDLLRLWSRWITPITEERRYDTWFFAAALPDGQTAQAMGTEADSIAWLDPAQTLAAAGRGEVALLPPTAVCLADLQACGDVATALNTPRTVSPLQPDVVVEGGEAWLTLPAEVDYPL